MPIGSNRYEREHFELMLRLRDESGSLVVPAEFIPAAERYNVMPAIDRWVVRQALDQFVYRSGTGVKPYTIAVNLSGTSLNDERFLEYLIAELSAHDLPPVPCALRSPKRPPFRIWGMWCISCANSKPAAAISRWMILAADFPRSCT